MGDQDGRRSAAPCLFLEKFEENVLGKLGRVVSSRWKRKLGRRCPPTIVKEKLSVVYSSEREVQMSGSRLTIVKEKLDGGSRLKLNVNVRDPVRIHWPKWTAGTLPSPREVGRKFYAREKLDAWLPSTRVKEEIRRWLPSTIVKEKIRR